MFSIIEGKILKGEAQSQSISSDSVDEAFYEELQSGDTGSHLVNTDKKTEVKILKTNEEFDAIEEDWNQLLEKTATHIFQSYEWQKLWWEHFRDNNKLHILTFRNREQLIGIAPFYLEETHLAGLYTYRSLQFMACRIPDNSSTGTFSNYSPSDYLDLIADPEYQEEVAEALMNYLEKNKDFFNHISLDELPQEGIVMQNIVPRIEERNWIYKKERREVCPNIELPETMDEYLYGLKRSIRYKLRSSKRKVTEENLYKVLEAGNEQELEVIFDNLVDLHQKRWNKQGYPGVFENERYEIFLREVAKAFLRRDWLRLKSSFDHDGNCLAVNLVYTFKDRVYDYQKAFDINSDLAKYSPGFALSYFLIDEAIGEGKKVFDLLRGGHKYKLRLASTAPQNWKITIYGTSDKNEIKHRLNKLINSFFQFKLQISRELLLLRIHIREWGALGFMSKYMEFTKDRFKEAANN